MGETPVLMLKVMASLGGSYLAGRLVLDGYAPLGSESRVTIFYASVFLAGVILLWEKSRRSKSLLLRALAFVGATVVIYNIAVVAGVEAYSRKVVSSNGAFATGMAVLGLLLPAAHMLLLAAPLHRAVVGILAAYAVWLASVNVLQNVLQGPGLDDRVGQTLFFGLWLLPYLVSLHARWPAGASQRLLAIALVVALVGGPVPPRAAGQTPAGAGAREAVRIYLETLQLVVSTVRADRSRPHSSRCGGDPAGVHIVEEHARDALGELYRATLSAHTRGRITRGQFFSAYLGAAGQEQHFLRTAGQHPGREFCVSIEVDVGEPLLNDRGDVALVPARVVPSYTALNRESGRPFTLHPWRWLARMVAGGSGHTLQHHVAAQGDITLALIVVREGHQWRVVLPDRPVQEIQKIAVSPALQIWPSVQFLREGPRYAPHAGVSDAGATLTVLDVALEQDETILRLTLANANQDAMAVADALRRATLTDEAGRESRARPPRDALSGRLAGFSTIGLTLVFDPIPAASRTATLMLPDLRVGNAGVTLKLTFAMRSATYPAVGETGIPLEPLLLYLLSVLKPTALRAVDEAPLRQFYQRHLAARTRGQITEADFVAHWTTRAHTQWQRAFGETGQIHDIDFVIGPPAYSGSGDHAMVPSTIKKRGTPSMLAAPRWQVEEIIFRVSREGEAWRLELPDRVVEEMHPPRPAGVQARWFPSARGAEAGVEVRVRQVSLEKDLTRLDVTVENGQVAEASLFEAMAGATLTNDHGAVFHTRMLRTTVPDRMAGRSSVTAVIAFEPIPAASTRLVLTIPGIRIADRSVTISLPIVLVRS